MIEKLNNAVNLLALAMICLAFAFAHGGKADIASNLVSGAIGIIGGGAIAHRGSQGTSGPNS